MVDCACVCVCECTYKQGVGGSFKNSNKKGLLGWPKGDKEAFRSCEQGWKELEKKAEDFFFFFKALCGPILPAIVMLA